MLDISISSAKTTAHAISVSKELGETIQKLSRDQKDLEKRLLKDNTKTKAARRLAASEAAMKKLKLAAEKASKIQTGLSQSIERFDESISKQMEIKGTTDYLILGGYAQALESKKTPDVLKVGDLDAYRAALLHPVLKLNGSIQKDREMIEEAAAKVILGDEAYQERQALKDQLHAAQRLELGLLETYGDYQREAEAVRANVVTDEDMEPALG
jgi:hypothetical protein